MKILLWDIETSFSVLASFGLYNDAIPFENILHEWYIICASWKWLDDDHIYSCDILEHQKLRPGMYPEDIDYWVVKKLHEVLMEADVIIAHNGDRFDLKKLQTRMIYYGMPPLPKIVSIDTLKVARKEFKFTSNRLDYIAQYLGLGEKFKTTKGLWLRVLDNDKEAIKEMVDYNKKDVIILEEVYLALRPYMKNHPNINVMKELEFNCPNCEGVDLIKRGFAVTRAGKYQRYQCQDCGAWSQGKKALYTTRVK